MTTARIGEIGLGYEQRGQGEPVVLLHGAYGTLDMFGQNLDLLAEAHRVIAVDLHSHGRSPTSQGELRVESMADDIAALIGQLGLRQAAVMGFSLGGAVALRTAIQHPDAVSRLVLVSTPFTRRGWYPEMVAALDAQGPEMADMLRPTPLYQAYERVAPNLEDWPVLVRQLSQLVKVEYDWSDEVRGLSMPVLLVAGDADGMPPSHAVEFFELLGGGQRDASWDRSGMTQHRLAILPAVTHYDINAVPALSAAVIPFLDGAG